MEFVTDEDLYVVLGVEADADDATIRKSYKKLAATLHPDRYIDRSAAEREDAQQRFSRVSYAYNVLKDPTQRNEYDFMRRMSLGEASLPEQEDAPPQLTREEVEARREMAEKQFRIGMNHQMEKNLKASLAAFKEAVRIDPTVAQYHTMLALTCQRMGWVAYGLAEVEEALRLDPKDQLALKLRGQLRAAEKAQEEEEELRANKGKKKKKKKPKKDEVVPETRASQRRKKLAARQQSFKKKRVGLLQSLLNAIFKKK